MNEAEQLLTLILSGGGGMFLATLIFHFGKYAQRLDRVEKDVQDLDRKMDSLLEHFGLQHHGHTSPRPAER